MSVVGYFELDEGKAHKIAAEVGQAVATWQVEAARLGLTQTEIDRMYRRSSTRGACHCIVQRNERRIMTFRARKPAAAVDEVLTLSANGGLAIIEAGGSVACPRESHVRNL